MDGGDLLGGPHYPPDLADALIDGVDLGFPFDSVPPPPPPPPPQQQQSAIPASIPMDSLGMAPAKRRGRPRKYAPDGSMIGGNSGQPSGEASAEPPRKRRGRPPGSAKKQQLEALGDAGTGFTPHVLTLEPGEDVTSRIMAFAQQGSHTTCVLSANGNISNATLRQQATSGGTVTYEGPFKIISLSGSFMPAEDGNRSRTGGLTVTLARPDGNFLGGAVTGMLVAATPVQVFLCSFIMEKKQPKSESFKQGPLASPAMPVHSHRAGPSVSPPSQETSSESSSEYLDSPIDQSDGRCNTSNQDVMSSFAPSGWALNQHRLGSGRRAD